jgi:hypothetical protein
MRAVTAVVISASAGISLAVIVSHHSPALQAARTPLDPAARWPVRFETNRGQAHRPAAFLGETRDAQWHFRLGSIEVSTRGTTDGLIRMTWVGASPFRLEPLDPLPLRSHYIGAANPAASPRDIPNFGALRYRNVYRGIDVAFYGDAERLAHRFIVSSGADARVIRIRLDGAREVTRGADGRVEVEGLHGERLSFDPPLGHQDDGSRPPPIAAEYRLDSKQHEITFALGEYDRSRPLVIEVRIAARAHAARAPSF